MFCARGPMGPEERKLVAGWGLDDSYAMKKETPCMNRTHIRVGEPEKITVQSSEDSDPWCLHLRYHHPKRFLILVISSSK